MTFNENEKKALKQAVEVLGYNFFHDMEVARGELDELSVQINENYGIKAADFKKMVKCHYKESMSSEKEKIDALYELYKGIVG